MIRTISLLISLEIKMYKSLDILSDGIFKYMPVYLLRFRAHLTQCVLSVFIWQWILKMNRLLVLSLKSNGVPKRYADPRRFNVDEDKLLI